MKTKQTNPAHTSQFSLPIFFIFKDGVGNPQPWMVFAKLRKDVVCYESHGPRQSEKHNAEKWLS